MQGFSHCIRQVGSLRLEAKSTRTRFGLRDQARLKELPQPTLNRGGVAVNHIVDLFGSPVSDRLPLHYLQDFELLDALDVISEKFLYYRR